MVPVLSNKTLLSFLTCHSIYIVKSLVLAGIYNMPPSDTYYVLIISPRLSLNNGKIHLY